MLCCRLSPPHTVLEEQVAAACSLFLRAMVKFIKDRECSRDNRKRKLFVGRLIVSDLLERIVIIARAVSSLLPAFVICQATMQSDCGFDSKIRLATHCHGIAWDRI